MDRRIADLASSLGRREMLRGAALAAATLAIPGRVWASPGRNTQGAVSKQLWFEHARHRDVYLPYTADVQADGTLWLEFDDGYAYAFAAEDWSLDREADGHRLWLRESDDSWNGYACLTGAEAQRHLVDLA